MHVLDPHFIIPAIQSIKEHTETELLTQVEQHIN